MQVLLTAVAYQSFGALLSRPGIEWLLMNEDGSLRDSDGTPDSSGGCAPGHRLGDIGSVSRRGPTLVVLLVHAREFGSSAGSSPRAPATRAQHFGALVANGVRVTNAHVNSLPIAEFVMRSVLDEFQDAAQWRNQAVERRWRIHDWREVSGSTWVIVGLGGIGTEVAHRAGAFGVRVIGSRRAPLARLIRPSGPSLLTSLTR